MREQYLLQVACELTEKHALYRVKCRQSLQRDVGNHRHRRRRDPYSIKAAVTEVRVVIGNSLEKEEKTAPTMR